MALQWAAVLLISGSRTGLRAIAIQTHNCALLPFLGGGPSYLRRMLTITQRKLLAGWYICGTAEERDGKTRVKKCADPHCTRFIFFLPALPERKTEMRWHRLKVQHRVDGDSESHCDANPAVSSLCPRASTLNRVATKRLLFKTHCKSSVDKKQVMNA